jgi:hypothetical protein
LINFRDAYDIEEDKMQLLNPSKLTLFLFCHEYLLMKFVLEPSFMIV